MTEPLRSDDQLGARVGAALRARHDGPLAGAPAVPFAALQRRADRLRHRHRVALAATTGAVAVAVAGVAGARVLGGDDGPTTAYATATPQQQAADVTGRYLPARVPDDLRLGHVMFQGRPTVQATGGDWVQVFASPQADLAHPGLLVRTSPPYPGVPGSTIGEDVDVAGNPGDLYTQPSGAMLLWVSRPDAGLYFTTADLSREQLLAVAAGAVVAADGRGVALTGLPTAWSEVTSAAGTSGPEVGMQWFGEPDTTRQIGLTITAAAPDAGFSGGSDQSGGARTLADGRPALLLRASDGLALWWRTAEGGTIALQANGLTEDELFAVADSVVPVDRETWETTIAGPGIEDLLIGPTGEVEGGAVTATTSAVTTPPGSGPSFERGGFTVAELPVGSWRTVGTYGYPYAVAHTADGEVVGLVLQDANRAGTCYLVPTGGAPLRPGPGPSSGTVDAEDPSAVAFTNDCTGATYTLAGDVVAGAAVGLTTFEVREGPDGVVEFAVEAQRPGRLAAG